MVANKDKLLKKLAEKQRKKEFLATLKKEKFHYTVADMEDAVVDGKWTVPPESKVLVSMKRDGKPHQSVCVVKVVKDDAVDTYDETLDHWFSFRVPDLSTHNIVVKKIP